jgi:nucleoside-diphosphate-sugar epimerase
MAQSSVFLTGATGYSGQAVLRELNRRGIPVTALVRQGTTLAGCETVTGDLANVGAVADGIRSSSAVIHLASPRGVTRDSVAWFDVRATREIIAAWKQGAFVYPSHATVYGVPEQSPLTEDHGLVPTIWYDQGKVTIERDLRSAGAENGRGPAVVLRPSLIFGSNDRRGDRQLFSWVYQLCRDGATFVFDSDEGIETYGASFVGEDDYARAVSDSLGLTKSGTFHVASGFCTWRDLIAAFDRELGRESKLVVRRGARARGNAEVRLGQSRTELDTSAFAGATGFTPRQTLQELVGRLVAVERQPVS